MDIANQLTKLREAVGWSKNKLAKESGVSQAYISQLEAGQKEPTVSTLQKICSALGIAFIDFFKEEQEEFPPEIRQIIHRAKTLTPAQLKALDNFLATLNGQRETQQVAEQKADYHSNLDALLPRDEINLAEALVKISEIVYLNSLTEQAVTYLHKKAVELYGVPVPPGGKSNIAAHGPKLPGQIKAKHNPWEKR